MVRSCSLAESQIRWSSLKDDGKTQVTDRWRRAFIDMWDIHFIDAEVPRYINFADDGLGDFQSNNVRCNIDWQEMERDGVPAAEFSFEGNDEMDPMSGSRRVKKLRGTQIAVKHGTYDRPESRISAV